MFTTNCGRYSNDYLAGALPAIADNAQYQQGALFCDIEPTSIISEDGRGNGRIRVS
ncbi:MAG: hypothetical protein WA947_18820 [Phormidesmis sp.]